MRSSEDDQQSGEARQASPSMFLRTHDSTIVLSGEGIPDIDTSTIRPYVQPTSEEFAIEQAAQVGLMLDPELFKQAAAATIKQHEAGSMYTMAQARKLEAEANLIDRQADEKDIANQSSIRNDQLDSIRQNISKWVLIALGLFFIIAPIGLYSFFVFQDYEAAGNLQPEMLIQNAKILLMCIAGVILLMGEKFITGGILVAIITGLLQLLPGKSEK